MLNVLIKETNEVKSLSIIDPKTKIDYIGDFVGNTGAFGREFEHPTKRIPLSLGRG